MNVPNFNNKDTKSTSLDSIPVSLLLTLNKCFFFCEVNVYSNSILHYRSVFKVVIKTPEQLRTILYKNIRYFWNKTVWNMQLTIKIPERRQSRQSGNFGVGSCHFFITLQFNYIYYVWGESKVPFITFWLFSLLS